LQWKEETNEKKSSFSIRRLQPACLLGFASLFRRCVVGDARLRGIDNIERDDNARSALRIDIGA
jgi:hypothetical protein